MKKPEPSNVVIMVFLSILLIFVLFAVGALANHFFRQVIPSNQRLKEAETKIHYQLI